MAGRRSAGGGAAAIEMLSQLMIQKRKDAQALKTRAAELYQKFAYEAVVDQVKKGYLRVDPATGKLMQSQPAAKPMKATDFLSPTITSNMLAEAQPGMPLPATRMGPIDPMSGERTRVGNIPVGPQGANTMNSVIQSGLAESPAAQYQGNRFSARQIPEGPYVPGPSGTAIGGGSGSEIARGSAMLPRDAVVGILNSSKEQYKQSSGRIRVRRKADGISGSILESDFDPAKYERI